LGPTVRLVKRTAEKLKKEIQITEKLCEGVFDLLRSGDIKTHNKMVIEAIRKLTKEIDVIVCAQGSMISLFGRIRRGFYPGINQSTLRCEKSGRNFKKYLRSVMYYDIKLARWILEKLNYYYESKVIR